MYTSENEASYIPSRTTSIETFKGTCNDYMDHIYSCPKCMETFSNSANCKKEESYDELWEMFSYILFAIFVLFLVDRLN